MGIGEVLWDIFPEGRQLGGAPFNFACNAQELGAATSMVSCIGNDELGRRITKAVREKGVDDRYIACDADHPTGTVSVKLDPDGNPDFTIHENVAWDFIPWNDDLESLAARCDAVAFGSLTQRSETSRSTIRRFLDRTREECIRVFDINLRQSFYDKEVIEESLRRANVLKINTEELRVVAELFDTKAEKKEVLSRLLGDYSLRLIALTKGARGSMLIKPSQISSHLGYQVEVVDSVGAGDAFTAAMVIGMLSNKDLDEINEGANRLASYVCTQSGALPKIPNSFCSIGLLHQDDL